MENGEERKGGRDYIVKEPIRIYREKPHKMKNLKLYEYYGPRGENSDTEERIKLLEEAQAKLEESIGLIDEALRGTTHQRHADAYLLGHLRNWMDSGNRFDMGIQQYIDKLREEEEYFDDEE